MWQEEDLDVLAWVEHTRVELTQTTRSDVSSVALDHAYTRRPCSPLLWATTTSR